MTLRLGGYDFDDVWYDDDGDVLYMRIRGAKPESRTYATAEGHAVSFDESGAIVGMTLVNAKWLVERDGKLVVTIPDRVEATAEELAPILN